MDLLPGLTEQSRAGSTSKKYELGFKRWKLWALHNGLGGGDILPASALPVALYLSSIMQSANTPGPVITAFYGIKWVHELFDMKAPTDSKNGYYYFGSYKANAFQTGEQERSNYDRNFLSKNVSLLV